jgi:hypothetical protein
MASEKSIEHLMQMLETAIKVGTIFILTFTPFPLSHFWLHEVAQRALEILVINIFFEQQPLLPLLLPGLHFFQLFISCPAPC